MKNVILLTVFIFFGVQFAAAQEIKSTTLRDLPNDSKNDEGANVPEIIKLNFDKAYPKNIAAWTIEDKYYMAEYKDSLHLGHIVTYDEYGNLKTVKDQMTPGSFPAPIDEYITKRYPNQTFIIWSLLNSDGTKLYYNTRKTETIWFDPDGKFRNKTKNKVK